MLNKTIYWIDNEKKITSVAGPWDEFAQENGGANLSSRAVQGRSLWEFVSGDVTRMWLDTLLQLVAVRGEPVEQPYRCDSPTLKRFMKMSIIPEESGVLRVEHTLVSTVAQRVPVHILHATHGRSGIVFNRCSVCGRIRSGQFWQEPDAAETKQIVNLNVRYAVCEACAHTPSHSHF